MSGEWATHRRIEAERGKIRGAWWMQAGREERTESGGPRREASDLRVSGSSSGSKLDEGKMSPCPSRDRGWQARQQEGGIPGRELGSTWHPPRRVTSYLGWGVGDEREVRAGGDCGSGGAIPARGPQ